ncbi:MAG: nitroreductase family protein [Chloroflexi bacterium]|nr:nitroreductase family protein [Chloroflexota bacterium]
MMNENRSKILAMIWRLKLRLQFTGWLQYLPPALFSLLLFFIAALARLFGLMPVTSLFLIAGSLLLAIFTFDLITVKFHLRPREPLPERQEGLDIFDLMRFRRSCRSFQTRKLTPADFDELMGIVRLHSAAATIGDAPIRFEYVAAPLTVWPVVNATEFLVAIAPHEYDRLAVIDIGRSLQKIVMDATQMGLGTCWIGPGADHASILRHLGDRFHPEQDHIICVCAVGYKSRYMPLLVRLMNRQLYGRLPLSDLFFADVRFKQSLPVQTYPFNQFGRSYEICQWSPSAYNGQTTRCVAVVEQNGEHDSEKPHLARLDFYAATDSRYYAAVALGIWCANWEMGCGALGIQGRFAQLSATERGVQDMKGLPALPRYDVSWMLNEVTRITGRFTATAPTSSQILT